MGDTRYDVWPRPGNVLRGAPAAVGIRGGVHRAVGGKGYGTALPISIGLLCRLLIFDRCMSTV